ncbi:MAG: hypothetical protein H0V89_08650 [Deltaproteobacteria bacterium]|nr:hypothetical protein [Deltaproteobacteria bacterium]
MKDTPDDVLARFEAMIMARPMEERVRMGGRMLQTSKHMVREALRQQYPDADEIELRRLFLRRFYGDELSDAHIEAVATRRR